MSRSLAETEDPPISSKGERDTGERDEHDEGERGRAVRTDAARNRRRLLEAARRAFTAGGGKVSLEAIAREAGVGIGTLYRHFPTREALAEAVYHAELGRLCESAGELLERHPPVDAVRRWMDRFADLVTTKQEMADALRAAIASGAISASRSREELAGAVRVLLDAGAADGTLRSDVRAEDVVAGVVGVFLACRLPDQRDQADRLLDLLLDGLRPAGEPRSS